MARIKVNRSWRHEWLNGKGTRFAIRGHVVYPSRYAYNLRAPSHWACALCATELASITWFRAPACSSGGSA